MALKIQELQLLGWPRIRIRIRIHESKVSIPPITAGASAIVCAFDCRNAFVTTPQLNPNPILAPRASPEHELEPRRECCRFPRIRRRPARNGRNSAFAPSTLPSYSYLPLQSSASSPTRVLDTLIARNMNMGLPSDGPPGPWIVRISRDC
jgi:hypothetical protein